jgi:hypothetical protein
VIAGSTALCTEAAPVASFLSFCAYSKRVSEHVHDSIKTQPPGSTSRLAMLSSSTKACRRGQKNQRCSACSASRMDVAVLFAGATGWSCRRFSSRGSLDSPHTHLSFAWAATSFFLSYFWKGIHSFHIFEVQSIFAFVFQLFPILRPAHNTGLSFPARNHFAQIPRVVAFA